MHTFDLNLDWVNEEEEEERRLSAEALGSFDEELNGFIDYFLHGSDSDVSQSNQSRLPEESISRSNGNEGMDLDFVELGLGLGLDLDKNNEASFDLNVDVSDLEMFQLLSEEAVQDVETESGESFSSMGEMELVREEDFRVLVNESNTNNETLELLSEVVRDVENESNIYNEIQFDSNDEDMMVYPDELLSNYNNEVDIEEGLGMIIDTADEDDGDDRLFTWNNVHNEIVEDVLGQGQLFDADDDDDGDDRFLSWNWNNSIPGMVEGVLEQFWRDFWPAEWSEWDTWDDTYISWSMQTVTCDVDNLPSITLTQEELNKNNSICAICMENFCIEEKLKRLPCFHYYHVDCISPWLRTRNTCPTCRYELPII